MFSVRTLSRVPKAAALALLVSVSFVAVAPLAAAQSTLDPVVVTGTREAQPLSRSAADLVFIDAQTIARSTADSVEDLLRREAGMQLVRTGGPGQSTGFFIRGASTNSTLVLIDGVRIGSATLGQAELEGLSLSQVDHIEVLRGPGSSLYGADGVGGVVQIFTRRGSGAPRLTAGAAFGRYRSAEGDVGVSGSQGSFDYALSLGHDGSRGVSAIRPNDANGYFNPDEDGYSRNTGNLRLGYTPAKGHRIGVNVIDARLHSRYDSADFDPVTFNPDPSPDFRSFLTERVLSADYRGELSSLWTTTVQLSRNLDDLTSGGGSFSRFITRRDQATWQNLLRFGPDQQVVLAYEHLREKAGGDVFSFEPKRNNNAFVAGYSGHFGPSDVQADVRHDDNSVYGGNTTGRLGYAFEVVPGLKLRALAGNSFRAPTFNDLFYPGFGVMTVQPERGRSVELGINWQRGDTTAAATVYRNRVRNLIAYQPDRTFCPPDHAFDFGCAGNVGRARLQGATFTAGQHWGGLDIHATVDLVDATNADTGHRLARRAAHQENLAADYAFGAWSIGGAALVVGSRPDRENGGGVLGGYGVFDLKATWRFLPQWRLEAKLLNALDHRVEPVRDYQGLGRQAWIGVRYDNAAL